MYLYLTKKMNNYEIRISVHLCSPVLSLRVRIQSCKQCPYANAQLLCKENYFPKCINLIWCFIIGSIRMFTNYKNSNRQNRFNDSGSE